MSSRAWIAAVAFGLVFSCSALGQDAELQPSPTEAQTETNDNDSYSGQSIAPGAVPEDLGQPSDSESGERADQRKPESEGGNTPWTWEWLLLGDNPAQATMAWASIIAAVAAVIAAVLLYCTFRETRRIGQAQVRAYLVCSGGDFIVGERSVYITVNVANKGQSPAVRCFVRARLSAPEIVGEGNNERLPGRLIFSDWRESSAIPISVESISSLSVEFAPFTDKQQMRLYHGADDVRGEIVVEWIDVFNDRLREYFDIRQAVAWGWNGDTPSSRIGKLEARSRNDQGSNPSLGAFAT